MPVGRKLRPDAIERLRWFRNARRLSVHQLKLAMAPAPFTWRVLEQALAGQPILERNYHFIVAWLDRHVPPRAERSGKDASAGNGREEAMEVTS